MEVWQNEGQLSKGVRLEIMFLSLKFSLVSMEQLSSKWWEVPAVIDHPTGDLEHLERKEPAWLCRMGRPFICVQAETAAEGKQNMQIHDWVWMGLRQGKRCHFGVLILARCTGMMPPSTKAETGEVLEHGQAAWAPLHCCLSLAHRTAGWGCCCEGSEHRIPFLC